MLLDITITLSICHYGYIFRESESFPGTTGLEEAWEVEHVRVPALLPPHSSNLDYPW